MSYFYENIDLCEYKVRSKVMRFTQFKFAMMLWLNVFVSFCDVNDSARLLCRTDVLSLLYQSVVGIFLFSFLKNCMIIYEICIYLHLLVESYYYNMYPYNIALL